MVVMGWVTFVSQASSAAQLAVPKLSNAAAIGKWIGLLCYNAVLYLGNVAWPLHLSPFRAIPDDLSPANPVIAGVVVSLFLGGWAVPFLSQDTIIGSIAPTFGTGIATVLCMVLHVVTFLLKVVVMVWVQMLIRWSLPRFRYDQVMDLCWKILLPLSVANIFLTAIIMLAMGSA